MQRLGQARVPQARTARLSVPRINARPRVGLGQAQRVQGPPRMGLAQHMVASKAAAASPVQSVAPVQSTTIPATQSTPVDPLSSTTPPPRTPNQPRPLFEIPKIEGFTPDPTYYRELTKLKFADEQKYAEGLAEQQHADTEYNDALQTAIRNRALQQRGLGENAIRANLGNSGWLDRSEAEDTTAYTQERAHAQLSKQEADAARTAAQNALRQGYGIEAASLLAEAAARYTAQREAEAEKASAAAPENGFGPPAVPVAEQGPWPGNWPSPPVVHHETIHAPGAPGIGKRRKAK